MILMSQLPPSILHTPHAEDHTPPAHHQTPQAHPHLPNAAAGPAAAMGSAPRGASVAEVTAAGATPPAPPPPPCRISPRMDSSTSSPAVSDALGSPRAKVRIAALEVGWISDGWVLLGAHGCR